ncbi:TasA family protein [Blastococcus haudaquaticus]|uniref:Camelysin metallo-endopeptidase n=1 Tax=Blastococcus haudaquaticus TaxID=1938745 RepID=A0A286HA01_9ACTN|nr:TasA family protein [Blastococcus haudaquaticus]SOE04084.1 Camelysin metallo-endopeptidase [Blastococcus haudaquaticus]
MSTKTIATSSTARKVVGSLGVIGAAAAVAGMGTFGSFTDSTTPVTTTVASGTVSIDLTGGEALNMTAAGFVPGDSLTRPVTLKNDGNSALSSVVLRSTTTGSSVLTSDVTNGLQLAVKSCAVAWTAGANNSWTCSSGERTLGSGPAVIDMTLNNPASLAAGASDNLAVSIALPTSADNTFQGKSAALTLTFIGSQRTATTR